MANTTYDWQPRMDKIIQMYLDGKPISDIHIAIQDPENRFTPKPRVVYNVLKKKGYPTKPKERESFLQQLRRQDRPINNQDDPAFTTLPTAIYSSRDDTSQSICMAPSSYGISTPQDHNISFTGNLHSDLGWQEFTNHTYADYEANKLPVMDSNPGSDEHPGGLLAWLYDNQTAMDDIEVLGAQYLSRDDPVLNPGDVAVPPGSHDSIEKGANQQAGQVFQFSDEAGLIVPEQNLLVDQISAVGSNNCLHSHSSRAWTHRSPNKIRTVQSTTTVSNRTISLLLSRFGSIRSISSDRWISEPMRDSGYSSGRNSPLVVLEEKSTSEQSLKEFKNLHRVPCILHEPRRDTSSTNSIQERSSKEQYRNVPTCPTCFYSAIHNLSWSATHFKLEVFQTELKLDSLYDITAVDIVGNSALHYAAAGGADSEHFISLMQAGVNPYQLNTEGQLFLHCLHPNDRLGADSLEMLILNLVNTLNYLNRTDAFASLRWRDNEGRTFLDTLATHIPDYDMKNHLFRLVENAGYIVLLSEQLSDFSYQTSVDQGFTATQSKQQKAWEILGHASDCPDYVDPETGDNVLHALAKLKLPKEGSVLQKLKDFASKDIDLNLHNRDRQAPLSAFIQERPCLGLESEETGATRSKYLDTLLWKDARHRIPNRINVNMRNKAGATALHDAAIRARPDSVRSLIEAGANVNACVIVDGRSRSILQATSNARSGCVNEPVKMHLYNEVISYLQHEGAVLDPATFEQRGLCTNSVRVMPL